MTTETTTTTTYSFGNFTVSLAADDHSSFGNLEDLHICHLGMRFIAKREIPLFGVYEFDMLMRPNSPDLQDIQLKCVGIVVSCEPEGSGFRTIIHFTDLGQTDINSLKAVTLANHMRCDYCENC